MDSFFGRPCVYLFSICAPRALRKALCFRKSLRSSCISALRKPCLTAFWDMRALPSCVPGPVAFSQGFVSQQFSACFRRRSSLQPFVFLFKTLNPSFCSTFFKGEGEGPVSPQCLFSFRSNTPLLAAALFITKII